MIVVCSWGSPGDGFLEYDPISRKVIGYDIVAKYISDLLSHGIVVVAAVGNYETENQPPDSPAAIPGVIAVGATNPRGTATPWDDIVADFSVRGPTIHLVTRPRIKPDVVAPGIIRIPPYYDPVDKEIKRTIEGTSFSTPLVAGGIAQIIQAFKEIYGRYPTPAEVIALLRQTTVKPAILTDYSVYPNPEAG